MADSVGHPKASVLMCAFNAERTIKGSLEALLNQTEREVEVLVVDDASTDETTRFLSEVRDPRVRILRNAVRRGIAASRNRGIGEARGQVLFIADSDDESPPGRIASQLKALGASAKLVMSGGFAEAVDDDGESLAVLRPPEGIEQMRAVRLSHSPMVHGTLAVRTEALRALGGYREKFALGSDYDLICRLVERFEGATLPEVLCRFRVSCHSSTVRHAAASVACAMAAKRFARERSSAGCDSYEFWEGVRLDTLQEKADLRRDYHLFAGKLAAAHGNARAARRHFSAGGVSALPYLCASWMGPSVYRFLQGRFGSPAI